MQESRPPLTERIKEAIGLKSHPPVPEVSCYALSKPTWEPCSALLCLLCMQEQRFIEADRLTKEALCFAEISQSRGAGLGSCPSRQSP